jgi:hypothetical protein
MRNGECWGDHQLLDDVVLRDGLADPWSRILLGQSGRVNESGGVANVSAKVPLWRLLWTTKSCKTL